MNKNIPADRIMNGAMIGSGSALDRLREAVDEEAKLQEVMETPNATVSNVMEMFKKDGALNLNRAPKGDVVEKIIEHPEHLPKMYVEDGTFYEGESPKKIGDSESRGVNEVTISYEPEPIRSLRSAIMKAKEVNDLFDDILLMMLYSDIYYYKCNFSLIGVSTVMQSIWTAKAEIVRENNRAYIKFDDLMFDISTLKCVEAFVITVINLIPINIPNPKA